MLHKTVVESVKCMVTEHVPFLVRSLFVLSSPSIPVPPKLASILQQANTSKSTSRLPPLSSRRGSVGSSAQQQTRTAHRRESADLSRDVVASMVYGHGKDTRRGSGFSGSDFGSSDFRFGK